MVAGCQTTDQPTAGEPLSPSRIKAEWGNRTLQGTTPGNQNFNVLFGADGTLSFSSGTFSDSGRWRLTDTGYCSTWTTLRQGSEECYLVRKLDSVYKIYKLDGVTLDNRLIIVQ